MATRSEQTMFQQLAFFRNMTVHIGKQIKPEQFDLIPTGYRNHLRWQLAHVWFVLERFVYHIGLQQFPDHDEQLKWYGNGSSPSDWQGCDIAAGQEWIERLAAQPTRIEQALQGRLDVELAEPFTFANGYTVTTARELLTYGIFHEGMHLATIRQYLKLLG